MAPDAAPHPRRRRLVVLGGAMLDVQALPSTAADVRPGGSVPGIVRQLPGGVGRNIAEAATQLLAGQPGGGALLLSVVGRDAAGDSLVASCAALGMETRGIARTDAAPTPCVCTVFDRSGEVAASVAAVEAVEQQLTPARLAGMAPDIAAAGLLVLDGNLSAAAFTAACRAAADAGVPALFEPVSVPKAARCAAFLERLAYVTPNSAELLAIASAVQQRNQQQQQRPLPSAPLLAGRSAREQLQLLSPFAAVVLAAGCRCIVLTLGGQGAALLTAAPGGPAGSGASVGAAHLPALSADVINLSGAGDCLVAGFAAAKLRGADDRHALAVGVAAATAAVQCPVNVPPALDYQQLERQALQHLGQLSEWQLPVPRARL